MKHLKLYLLPLILLCSITAFSQNSLTGKITDSTSKSTLPETIIYIHDLKISAQANTDGIYMLNNIPKGTFVVEVQILGYKVVSLPVKVDGAVTQNFA